MPSIMAQNASALGSRRTSRRGLRLGSATQPTAPSSRGWSEKVLRSELPSCCEPDSCLALEHCHLLADYTHFFPASRTPLPFNLCATVQSIPTLTVDQSLALVLSNHQAIPLCCINRGPPFTHQLLPFRAFSSRYHLVFSFVFKFLLHISTQMYSRVLGWRITYLTDRANAFSSRTSSTISYLPRDSQPPSLLPCNARSAESVRRRTEQG